MGSESAAQNARLNYVIMGFMMLQGATLVALGWIVNDMGMGQSSKHLFMTFVAAGIVLIVVAQNFDRLQRAASSIFSRGRWSG